MKRGLIIIAATLVASSIGACKKKDDQASAAKDEAAPQPADKPTEDKPTEDKPTEDKPAALPDEPMVDLDLAPFGAQFAGYVVSAPQSAKVEFDDPSRHIVLSDTDFITVEEAPYWEDGIKALSTDKDNQNIKQVSPTEVRYERTPPLGKSWLVDMQVMVGKEKWSCGTGMTGTFTSEAMADRISAICKSLRKK